MTKNFIKNIIFCSLWAEYTEKAAIPQVPKADALKIAAWINSLK